MRVGVSVGRAVGGAAVVVAGAGVLGTSTGAAEGSVQVVSRKLKMNKVTRKFFIIAV